MDVFAIITHPGFGALLFVLLALWPVARILQRAGHHPALALVLSLNLAVPMLGLIAVALVLCRKPKIKAAALAEPAAQPQPYLPE